MMLELGVVPVLARASHAPAQRKMDGREQRLLVLRIANKAPMKELHLPLDGLAEGRSLRAILSCSSNLAPYEQGHEGQEPRGCSYPEACLLESALWPVHFSSDLESRRMRADGQRVPWECRQASR